MSLSTESFEAVADLFHGVSGIRLNESKRPLVVSRLQKLASAKGVHNLDDYVSRLISERDPAEVVQVIDKLTTNETYFFREPQHFEFLAELLANRRSRDTFRVWSAASSSGEEAYSIAMLLAEKIGPTGWEVVGTDLSTAMVASARRALYPMERARHMPHEYLRKYCLKGQDAYEGHLLISKTLRAQVSFQTANLMEALPPIGQFDVIFLRNVLIYFDPPSKEAIVNNVTPYLKPHGHLLTGHAESITQFAHGLQAVRTAVYARAN